jgi:hypothetical protein
MATRERSFDGQRAEAREPRSQEAKAGKAEGDRNRALRLGSSAESRREDVTSGPDVQPLHYFASLRNRRLSAFTVDEGGSNLPAEHGPWVFDRTIARAGVWRDPAPRSLVEARLERDAVYLWIQ